MLSALLDFFGNSKIPKAVVSPSSHSVVVDFRKTPHPEKKTIIDVKLKPGGLSRFGYHAENSIRSRHIALLRAAREEGFVPIIQRLNLTATFLKNNSPRISRIFKADQRWLSAYYKSVHGSRPRPSARSQKSALVIGGTSKITSRGVGSASPMATSVTPRRSSRLSANPQPMYPEGDDESQSSSTYDIDEGDYDDTLSESSDSSEESLENDE